jgi:hypothetical protein
MLGGGENTRDECGLHGRDTGSGPSSRRGGAAPMTAKGSLAIASFFSCLLLLAGASNAQQFGPIGLSFTGTDSSTGLPVKGLFEYDPAQLLGDFNGDGGYFTRNTGAATFWYMFNGTNYAVSSDPTVPNTAIVVGSGGNGGHTFSSEISGPSQTAFTALTYNGPSLPQPPTSLAGVQFTGGDFSYNQVSPYPNVAFSGQVNVSSIAPLPNPIPSDEFGGLSCGSALFTILCVVGATLAIGAVAYLCPPCVAGVVAATTALSPAGPVATTATAPPGILVQAVSGGMFHAVGMPPASVVANSTNYIIRAGSTIASVAPGGQFNFPQNVSRFTITGIDFDLLSSNGFPASFTLVEDGNPVSIQATPGGDLRARSAAKT